MKRHSCVTNVIWALMTCSKTLDPQNVRKNWKGLGDDLVQLSHFIDKPRPRIFSDLFKVTHENGHPQQVHEQCCSRVKRREPPHTVGETVNWHSHRENSKQVLKKLKIELPYDPTPLLCAYPENSVVQRDACSAVATAAPFTEAGTGSHLDIHQQKNGWMCYIHTVEHYSAVERHGILPFAAKWMDLESVILREVSQTEKKKYRVTPLICRSYLQNRNSLRDLENELTVARGRDGKGVLGSLGWTCTHRHI